MSHAPHKCRRAPLPLPAVAPNDAFRLANASTSPVARPSAHQRTAVAETEAALAAGEKVILVAPTGSGKTVMGAAIAKHTAEQHRGVLFLAHRREIIDQTSCKLHAHGVRHGVIMAGVDTGVRWSVQVASVSDTWAAVCARTQCRCRRQT